MNELIVILKYRLVWLNVFLCIILTIISFYFSVVGACLFVLISNFFDILGYHFSLIRRSDELPEKIIVRAYRVNQFLFDLLLLILVGILFGWVVSFCGWIMKEFGVQDILYYIFLKTSLPQKWNWMRWTPLGFFKSNLTRSEILIQGTIGILISLIILYLY